MMNIKKMLSAFAVITSAITCAITVNAQAETIDFDYVEAGSTANSAVVTFGATGFEDVASYEVYIESENNAIVDFNIISALDGMEHSYVAFKDTSIVDGVLGLIGTTAGVSAPISSPGTILEIELVFENDITEDVVVNLIDGNSATFIEGTSENCWVDISEVPVSLIIPAAKPAGPTPIDAAKLDTYDTYADAAVTAYTAVVPAADVDKTFEWGFKNADGVASAFTKVAKFEYKTVVSGESGIVLGLKVAGDMPEGVSVTLTEVE